MHIIICDDDLQIQELLVKYIREYFHNNNLKCPELSTFDNGEALLRDTSKKDIIFLDVEMPGVSGIYTGKALKQQNPNVIIFIVTSYIEYLDEAMRFRVFRYLSKPIDKLRLFRNLKDALRLYNTLVSEILIETKQGVHSVLTSDIVLIEAKARKVTVHTRTTTFETINPIQYWMEKLNGNGFYQTHRSFIVNMKYINFFDHTIIRLYNDQFTAYLTRRKYTDFKKAYLLYIESLTAL